MLRRSLAVGLSSARRQPGLAGVSSSLSTSMPSTNNVCNNFLFQNVGACRHRSNRSRRGLYDGKDIRTGNNVSFSMKSTKRKFKPNVFTKRVYSEVLDEMVRFHITTSALRSIDKAGGLDNYLLTSKHIASGEGLAVKKRIVNQLKYEKRQKAKLEEEADSEKQEDPAVE